MDWEQLSLFDSITNVPVKCDKCGQVEPNEYLLEMNHGHATYDEKYCWKQMRTIWRIQSAKRTPALNYAVDGLLDEARELGLSEADYG